MRALLLCLFGLPAALLAQANLGPITAPQVNLTYYAGSILYPTIQSAVTAACASTAGGTVTRLYGSIAADSPTAVTGGCTKVLIFDNAGPANLNFYAWSAGAYSATPAAIAGGLSVSGVVSASTSVTTPAVIYSGQREQAYHLIGFSATTWVKLGTWTFGGADTLRIVIDSGSGFNSNASQQASATLIARSANAAAAPNLSGLSVTIVGGNFGTPAVLAATAQATGGSAAVSNGSWDIYVQMASFADGQYHVDIANAATWTDVQSVGVTPSLVASSTVVPGLVLNPIDHVGGIAATHINNATGAQLVTASGCTYGAGAVGNNCTTTITLPVAEPDTSYYAECSLASAAGTVLSDVVPSTGSFTVISYALNTTATGGGSIRCAVFHN